MTQQNIKRINAARATQAATRRVEMQKLVAEGKTNKEISEVLGVAPSTIANNLAITRKDPLAIVDEKRRETLDELMQLKNEVKSHRKGDKPLPLAAVDRLIKIAEVVMRLEGTAAPTKSIVGHLRGPQLDALYLDIRQELLHLSDDDKHEALLLMREFAKSRKKPVLITTKFIGEGNDNANFS